MPMGVVGLVCFVSGTACLVVAEEMPGNQFWLAVPCGVLLPLGIMLGLTALLERFVR